MVFSNTTDKSGLVQQVEVLTGLGDGAISGNTTLLKQVTAMINRAYFKVVTMILESADSWNWDDNQNTDYPIATTPLVANQRDYVFPTSLKILKIRRVDISYDGTNYHRATPFDIGAIPEGTGATPDLVDQRFSAANPGYDIQANAVFVYPIPSASTGYVRIVFEREITEFTSSDTTDEPGISRAFHPLIAFIASQEYAIANDLNNRVQNLTSMVNDEEVRLRRFYSTRDEDTQTALKADIPNYR